jgi:lipoate-protein ligase A
MLYPFRLLHTGCHDAFYNMGFDEALLERVSAGKSPPVLRLYGWKPAAVSIGYFQKLEEEVDIASCARHGVDLVRRISGGGAVFHHEEITYSLIMPLSHPLAASSIMESYGTLCSGLTAALGLLGIEAVFAPINDILAGKSGGGKKISGNAQTRRQGCVLQHGTVLLDLDPRLMFTLLRVPQEKLKGKLIEDIRARVSGLYTLLGRKIPFEEAARAMAEGFKKALSLEYVSKEISAWPEEQRALVLAKEKFAAPKWLNRR